MLAFIEYKTYQAEKLLGYMNTSMSMVQANSPVETRK